MEEGISTSLSFCALQNKLLKDANKRKLWRLQYNKNPIQRREEFMNWYDDLTLLLTCYEETAPVVAKPAEVTLYPTQNCAGNKALYGLIMVYCDRHCKTIVSRTPLRGDAALHTLRQLYASVSPADKNFYN